YLFRPYCWCTNELHLFGLAVSERRCAFERVQVVFIEGFFRDWRLEAPTKGQDSTENSTIERPSSRLNFVYIASHELDTRILERFTGLVVHGDPTYDVPQVAFFRRDNVVISLPAHSSCDIGKLSREFPRLVSSQRPLQARLQNRVVRETRK